MNIPVITPAVIAQRLFEETRSAVAGAPSAMLLESSMFLPLFGPTLVILGERADLFHQMVGDLFVSPDRVALFVESRKVHRLAEPDADLLAACPIPEDLFRKIVYQ